MIKILLVKTTSLGDVVHTMPAVSDLQKQVGDCELHWLVEESFKEIPRWHPLVKKVHTCAIRRWRKSFFSTSTRNEIKQLKQSLRAEDFDFVIDAQGLIKSALMVRWLNVPKYGYDKKSIREPLASRFYTHRYTISRELTAIERVKTLFAQSVNYAKPEHIDFGMAIQKPEDFCMNLPPKYAVFLHGTNWVSKIWPEAYWQALAEKMIAEGITVYLPYGNAQEKQVAESIASATGAVVLDKLSLTALAFLLQQAMVVVGSDTGLSHIAAALDTPTLGIYGATNSGLTGLVGKKVLNLQSTTECSPCMKKVCPLVEEDELMPCYQRLDPDVVWKAVKELINK